jgi:hypothetical protein
MRQARARKKRAFGFFGLLRQQIAGAIEAKY